MNPTAQPWPDSRELTASWSRKLGPTASPLGNELRTACPKRWVRLYYLPQGERIVTTAWQRAEVEQRFSAILAALGAPEEGRLVVTTCGWGSPAPAARPVELATLLPAAHWRDDAGSEPDGQPITVYASAVAADSPALTELLLDWVAADRTAEVIMAPADFSWLIHPYDGGFDVIARNAEERAHLASKFSAWLSGRVDGL